MISLKSGVCTNQLSNACPLAEIYCCRVTELIPYETETKCLAGSHEFIEEGVYTDQSPNA